MGSALDPSTQYLKRGAASLQGIYLPTAWLLTFSLSRQRCKLITFGGVAPWSIPFGPRRIAEQAGPLRHGLFYAPFQVNGFFHFTNH